MNESQQLASLAGIPMDQIKEFVRQYIELAMSTNSIVMWVSGIIFPLCVLGLIKAFSGRRVDESLGKMCCAAGLIAAIVFASAAWDRYKMTHYPVLYVIQDLRSSK
ncbi:hypothetical protein DRD23_09135 [Salmonella enterica subsp. enterica serovar Enteritidis]|nr:hypothetical protein [Salmonella enterica subsp. enterica serovar Enteritidis]